MAFISGVWRCRQIEMSTAREGLQVLSSVRHSGPKAEGHWIKVLCKSCSGLHASPAEWCILPCWVAESPGLRQSFRSSVLQESPAVWFMAALLERIAPQPHVFLTWRLTLSVTPPPFLERTAAVSFITWWHLIYVLMKNPQYSSWMQQRFKVEAHLSHLGAKLGQRVCGYLKNQSKKR